jgi:hypothetical protein
MEVGVMSGSINTFFAGVTGTAQALGDLTATNAVTKAAVLPGAAIGYAAAIAVAQDTAPGTPHTSAMTDGLVAGGYITNSHSVHMSVDFLYGPTPASVDVFVTSLSTHGGGDNFLSGYSLASPSVHGLF